MTKNLPNLKLKKFALSKYSFHWFLIPCSLFLIPNITTATTFELEPQFRENFSNIVKELCYSAIEYKVDDSFIEKQAEYQQTINCLFNDGYYQVNKNVNKKVKKQVSAAARSHRFELPEMTSAEQCDQKTLADIQGIQTQTRGFVSRCEDVTDNVRDSYSSCRMTETVLLERCGYEKFLLAKQHDFNSFKREHPQYKNISNKITRLAFDQAKSRYQRERNTSQQALREMLELYRQYEQTYRNYSWLRLIESELLETTQLFTALYRKIFTFPDKFVRAQRG